MDINHELGICIKNADSSISYQNEKCIKLCGDRYQQKCQDSCMKSYQLDAPLVLNQGMKLIKNIESPNGKVDALIINNGQTITTLLYDLDEKFKNIEKTLEEIKQCDLSKSETSIIELILKGMSKKEIMKKLFISEATIKTHLNNIYKKLPSKWQILKKR